MNYKFGTFLSNCSRVEQTWNRPQQLDPPRTQKNPHFQSDSPKPNHKIYPEKSLSHLKIDEFHWLLLLQRSRSKRPFGLDMESSCMREYVRVESKSLAICRLLPSDSTILRTGDSLFSTTCISKTLSRKATTGDIDRQANRTNFTSREANGTLLMIRNFLHSATCKCLEEVYLVPGMQWWNAQRGLRQKTSLKLHSVS